MDPSDDGQSSRTLCTKNSFSMDELCNFEAHGIYASLDMNLAASDAHVTVDESVLLEADEQPTYVVSNPVNEAADSDPLDGVQDCMTPSRVQEDSISASHVQIEFSSGSSPVSVSESGSTGYTGTTTSSEDDADECNSQKSTKSASLLSGGSFEPIFPESIVLCINAGGSSIRQTSFGADFSEDCYFEGGDVLCTGESITGTKDACLYQTARYGNFSYVIQDIPPGVYLVDLHFAEIIFTNGPPGLRVFDVLIQNEKVVSKLDIYARVGSNTPLILANAKTIVKDNGLLISFRTIVGSPTISGICIRKANVQDSVEELAEARMVKEVLDHDTTESAMRSSASSKEKEFSCLHVQSDGTKIKKKNARRKLMEYELKLQALKNEVHEAWMSVQDANRKNEKLQNELDCRSLHVDSLAHAVERQLIDLKEVQDKADCEKQKWFAAVFDIAYKFQLVKRDFSMLANETREWVSSFPAIQDMNGKVQGLVDELEDVKRKYVKQGQDLRLYYNQVLELKGNIRVFCRCRPLSDKEASAGASAIVEFDGVRDNELTIRSNGSKKQYKFDRVFTPFNNQSDVFEDTAPVVVSVLDGYNVCIFAYGQTGTGKTFTMEGTESDRGVNYRTLEELFRLASERKGQYEYSISVSVLEVYNEQIRDLLATPPSLGQCAKKLEIKKVADGVHHVPGLTEARVQNIEEVWDVLQTGNSARAVSSTNCNEHSSRSHCMLCVMVKGESLITGDCTRSKLWLVDLAGSERVAKSDVQGERLKEAQSINKSLSALGDVIYALSTKSNHVPYRNSKLTHLLQDSLGGESKTLMFVQISPNELDVGETICSLNFASRVRGIELGPARRQVDPVDTVKYKQMVEKFKQEGKLKDESLRKQEDSVKKLEEMLKMKEQACRVLSDKTKEYEGTLMNERKARSSAEMKVKEQQALIEKLRQELKTRESRVPVPSDLSGDRRVLRPVPEALTLVENRMEQSSSDKCDVKDGGETAGDAGPADSTGANNNKSPGKMKAVPFRFNIPSPSALSRRPGRISLCVMPRRRPSLSMANGMPPALPYSRKVDPGNANSVLSSAESLQDEFGDENQLPNLPKCSAVSVTSPKPSAWKKGTPIAPSTVLRRSIPRKVHFKSPHLQPNYMKDGGRAMSNVERVMMGAQRAENHQNEGGGGKGANKVRRVSIATVWGRPAAASSNGAATATAAVAVAAVPSNAVMTLPGGAQRVPVGNKSSSSAAMYHRERGWNR